MRYMLIYYKRIFLLCMYSWIKILFYTPYHIINKLIASYQSPLFQNVWIWFVFFYEQHLINFSNLYFLSLSISPYLPVFI